jgi:hypothetical protein
MHKSCDQELFRAMQQSARSHNIPMVRCGPCSGYGERRRQDAELPGRLRAVCCFTCQGYGWMFQVGPREVNIARMASLFPR